MNTPSAVQVRLESETTALRETLRDVLRIALRYDWRPGTTARGQMERDRERLHRLAGSLGVWR